MRATPNLDAALAVLDGSGLALDITETHNADGRAVVWNAAIRQMSCLHMDGIPTPALPPGDPDYRLAELAATGADRDQALAELTRRLMRLTYATSASDLDLDTGTYRWRCYAYVPATGRLEVTGDRTGRAEVQGVLAA